MFRKLRADSVGARERHARPFSKKRREHPVGEEGTGDK